MWKLDGTMGVWDVAGTTTRVDVAHPEKGFLCSASNGRFMQLLPADATKPLKLADAYVRGNDLVALYEPQPPMQVQPQVYWRARQDAGQVALGVEMIVSMQTSLLDSNPETVVATGMPTGAIWGPAEGQEKDLELIEGSQFPLTIAASEGTQRPSLLVFQPRDTEYAYLEMVHPADFVAIR